MSKPLRILLYGTSLDPELDNRLLYDETLSQSVECVKKAWHESEALSMIERERLNTVFVNPVMDSDASVDDLLKFIEKIRTRFPQQVAVVLYADLKLARTTLQRSDPSFPFERYIRVDETAQGDSYFKEIETALRKCRAYVAPTTQQHRQTEVSTTPSDRQQVPTWFPKAGFSCIVLFIFFIMALIVASMFGLSVPQNSRMLVVFLLATVLAAGFSFIGSTALAEGLIPIPGADKSPVRFATGGGFAAFVIAVLIGYLTYAHVPEATGSSNNNIVQSSAP